MARANLNISQNIQDSFSDSQLDSSNVRALKVTIIDENLVLSSTIKLIGTSENDFNECLTSHVIDTEACFIIYRLSETALDKSKKWLLIVWIPEHCKVREKMLYSSSREDLKTTLGLSHFTTDYTVHSHHELSWQAYINSLNNTMSTKDIMTEKERVLQEGDQLSNIERNALGQKSTAMGVIPFTIHENVIVKFQEYIEKIYNWIELYVKEEVIYLDSFKLVTLSDPLNSYVNPNEARFILTNFVNHENKIVHFLVYSCPENIPIRQKMTMSTSKAALIDITSKYNIKFDKTIEIHDTQDLLDAIQYELRPLVESNSSSAHSTAATLTHMKPMRPGRSRTTVIKKFEIDEN